MTEPLFREDAYRLSCEAMVRAVDASGAIILDRTVFYPAGGGQPGDRGTLGVGDRVIEIIDAAKGADGAILHIPAPGEPICAPGERVEAVLDWTLRQQHMRAHTALHLLSVVIPLPVTGGAVGAAKGRLDFDMPETPDDKAALEAELNALIAADHPVAAEWITEAELEASPGLVKTMAVKPPLGQGHVRLIRIGAGEGTVDLQPCGGTHVRSTAEIGRARLGKIEKKGKRNRRVSLVVEA